MGITDQYFDEILDAVKVRTGAISDLDLTTEDLKEVSELFLNVVEETDVQAFP